jgi:two-component system OmpR family response regulator
MSQGAQIVVVDDCSLIRDAVSALLEREGFGVTAVTSGRELREIVEVRAVDLVVVDLQMPGEDGYSLTRFLRETCDCGIIMLTGKADTTERVIGLEVGADDFVAKPYEARELVARVRSVLRRSRGRSRLDPGAPPEGRRSFGGWALDLDARRVLGTEGRAVELTTAEFNLLSEFTGKPGRVLTREFLLQAVYARPWDYYDRSIDVLVTRLKRKLEQAAIDTAVIKSVRGAGYVFRPAVAEAA